MRAGEIGSAGLEPARSYLQKILSLLRLPFRHEPDQQHSQKESSNASGRLVWVQDTHNRD